MSPSPPWMRHRRENDIRPQQPEAADFREKGMPVEIVILPDAADVGRVAASMVADVLAHKPDGALGLDCSYARRGL